VITISGLAKSYGGRTLFSDVDLQLTSPRCYGVVGANGSGKSTFARVVAGAEPASDGTVSIPKRARIGWLRQDRFAGDEERILDVAMQGREEAWRALRERDELLAVADGGEFDAERYAALEDEIARHDAYALEARAGEVLEGLGIPSSRHREPLGALSGGFKLRAQLAQVLASDPDVLILDEPTNHLDIISIRWLETFLSTYKGCAILVSHDRRFLDAVCTDILDVDYETIIRYAGGYEDFEKRKTEERSRREHEISKQQKEIADREAFIARFKAKATKARQAQSRVKQLARIEIDELAESSRRYPNFHLPIARPSGKDALRVEGLGKSYGDHRVLGGVGLDVRRGERVAIVGPNGVGKSTLLKILVGELEADEGAVTWGHETHLGYFPQDHGAAFPSPRDTVLSYLWSFCAERSASAVRGELGRVLFSNDDVDKSVSSLSGGEAARLLFARLAVQEPNVLVLDEPTNHLDLEAIAALAEMLEGYEGTLLFVSHDRWFVSRLATRIVDLRADQMTDYPGTWDEYLAQAGEDHLDGASATRAARAAQRAPVEEKVAEVSKPPEGLSKNQRRQLERRLEEVTGGIEGGEAEIARIEARYCEAGFFEQTSPDEVKALQEAEAAARARVESLMEEWASLEERLG
jgi:ATPase subunit of ABC transporter with duplicated ATPase domains